MATDIVTTLAATSGFIGLASTAIYFYLNSQSRRASRSVKEALEGESGLKANDMVSILREFKDDASRLEALKHVTQYDARKAARVLDKVKDNVDLNKIANIASNEQIKLAAIVATTCISLSMLGLIYSLNANAKDPKAPISGANGADESRSSVASSIAGSEKVPFPPQANIEEPAPASKMPDNGVETIVQPHGENILAETAPTALAGNWIYKNVTSTNEFEDLPGFGVCNRSGSTTIQLALKPGGKALEGRVAQSTKVDLEFLFPNGLYSDVPKKTCFENLPEGQKGQSFSNEWSGTASVEPSSDGKLKVALYVTKCTQSPGACSSTKYGAKSLGTIEVVDNGTLKIGKRMFFRKAD